MKRKVVSQPVQKAVADVLTRFMFQENITDVFREWEEIFKDYGLFLDPFTSCPCSWSDYVKMCKEHEKQMMLEKYGHFDGLE